MAGPNRRCGQLRRRDLRTAYSRRTADRELPVFAAVKIRGRLHVFQDSQNMRLPSIVRHPWVWPQQGPHAEGIDTRANDFALN